MSESNAENNAQSDEVTADDGRIRVRRKKEAEADESQAADGVDDTSSSDSSEAQAAKPSETPVPSTSHPDDGAEDDGTGDDGTEDDGAEEEAAEAKQAPSEETDSAEAEELTSSGKSAEKAPKPRRRVFSPAEAKAEEKRRRKKERKEKENRPVKGLAVVNQAGTPDEDIDFATLFAEQESVPQQSYEAGTEVVGTVLQVGAETTFVDLGGKTEGFILTSEILDGDGKPNFAEGDSIKARVIREEAGGIRLARTLKGGGNVAIAEAYGAGVPVQGRVTSVNKGGFEVEVMGSTGFCPISMIELGYTEEPEVHLGQTYSFKIIEFEEDGRRLVLSRAALLEEEAKEKAAEVRENLEVGAVMDGVVSSVQNYGAFVDLGGGVDGLVHVSEMSHQRVEDPSSVLSPGDQVKVKVLKVDTGKKGDRISLSIKATETDPWTEVGDWLKVGAKLTGTVTRLAPFGAFVELQPGVEGLVHVSEMSWERHVKHPKEVVTAGDQVDVAVQDIDLEQQRIGLSLKAAHGDPWEGVEERYTIGQQVTGTVERVVDFGVFVKVEPGVVALLPMSELDLERGQRAERVYLAGEPVEAKVIATDEERRRLTLSRKSDSERRDNKHSGRKGGRKQPRDSGRREYEDSGGNFATLGDLLKSQLEKK